MGKSERFGLVMTPVEKQVLDGLAEAEGGLSQAAVVRRLIRQEAHRRGLWPNIQSRCPEKTASRELARA